MPGISKSRSACLRRKVCGFCDQPLQKAERGQCASLFDRAGCWWVPTIRDYGAIEALRMSRGAAHLDRAVEA